MEGVTADSALNPEHVGGISQNKTSLENDEPVKRTVTHSVSLLGKIIFSVSFLCFPPADKNFPRVSKMSLWAECSD